MQKSSNNCLGCRTFFEQNEALPLQTMTVQYKNFNIPIVEQKHKWTLLKTVISFLNTKGGTIYIGVQDSKCQVQGKQLPRKIRDEFKLALSQLIQRVCPTIDLYNKQEVNIFLDQLSVQFVPVVKNKIFSGKYITKINVKQGDPGQTYFRHNMGGTKQVKGMKLIEEAIKKAQNPPPKVHTFHEQCNPEPPELQVEIKKIGFKNIGNRESRRKFEKIFKQYLQKLGAQCTIAFDGQLKAVIIDFPTVEEFTKINNFIKSNLSFLNESQNQVRFVVAGDYLDIFFYQNTLYTENDLNSTPKKQTIPQNTNDKNEQKKNLRKFRIEQDQTKQQIPLSFKQTSSIQKENLSITFTHINPSIKQKLANYLHTSISKKIQIESQIYENTIVAYFENKQQLQKYLKICTQVSHLTALSHFGFHGEIKIGISNGHLHILNYDKSKQNKFNYFLRNLMGQSLKQIQILKKGNRYVVDCKMESNEAACQWLDKLLINKNIKDFRIPGAQNGSAPKMKVFIDCQLAI